MRLWVEFIDGQPDIDWYQVDREANISHLARDVPGFWVVNRSNYSTTPFIRIQITVVLAQ